MERKSIATAKTCNTAVTIVEQQVNSVRQELKKELACVAR